MKIKKENILKLLFIISSILFIIPSLRYFAKFGTVYKFDNWFKFMLDNSNREMQTLWYIIILALITIFYILIIKNRNKIFKNIKNILIYIALIGTIYVFTIPFMCSDVFYYLGVGRIDQEYNQNPYYSTIKEYVENNQNEKLEKDTVLMQGNLNDWADTTVVYGPIWQLVCKGIALLSFGNIDIGLLVFKIINLIIHILNCYLIYKISNKKIFSVIYGLNPSILLEFIGNMHNDTILVAFILLAIYFIYKKNNLKISILFLALSTGMKYFSILLLPFFIIYYYRDNKKITYRFIKCIQYGIIFLGLILLEYLFYFQDYTVLIGIITQTSKYSKSIYSAILLKNKEIVVELRYIVLYVFYLYYIKVFTEIIFEKNIKWRNVIKKCNNILVFSMLLLTTFQQWYLIWLFTIIMWQNNKKINRLLSITIITELANAIYMYKSEWYIYDGIFVMTIICLFILNIFTQKILQNFRKEQKDENKQKV